MHTLFLVDDNTIDHFIMMNVLKKNPIFNSIKKFDSGEGLIDHLENSKSLIEDLPDVLFLDLSMPKFDGWDVLNTLSVMYDSLAKKINVYIISASVDKRDKIRALTYPFVRNFFSKPVTSNNFVVIAADIESYWNNQKFQEND